MRPGEDLGVPGEPIGARYEVLTGCCFLYLPLADGRRQILHFALPGEVIDPNGYDGPEHATYGVQALVHSLVAITPPGRFRRLEADDAAAALALWRRASWTRDLAFERLSRLGNETAAERIAHLVLQFCVRATGEWPVGAGRTVPLPFRQEHVADATALSREHVSRSTARFNAMGVLGYRRGVLTAIDPARLARLAGLDDRTVAGWLGGPGEARQQPACPQPEGRTSAGLAKHGVRAPQ